MTVKKTLSLTERHHDFLARKVAEGVFATASAGVAAGVERLMEDEREREAMIDAMAETIRERAASPPEAFRDPEEVFAAVRARLAATSQGDDAA